MRWKLLLAFGGTFTLVFVVVAIWILSFTTDRAGDRVRDDLRAIAVGGAATIDAERFAALVETGSNGELDRVGRPDVYPDSAGTLAGTRRNPESEWPTDLDYWAHVNELLDIRRLDPEASPYSFVVGDDGVIRFVGSWGAAGWPTVGEPPDGARFLQPGAEVVDDETLEYFARGAAGTTEQPAYSDEYGSWVSAYSPIVDADGNTVGVLGVDYSLNYVNETRSSVVRVLYPLFGVAYAVLLAIVTVLSRWLTRRLTRLSAVTRRVADGDYDIDLSGAAHSRFPDEMTELAQAFAVMADRVGRRERKLVRQVQVLQVEIDQEKRKRAVAEITETEFFANLTSAAAAMRAKVRDLDRSSNGEVCRP